MKDKNRIQSCVDHINTAVDVDPWAKELVAEMGKEILEQLNNPNDCISRQMAIGKCKARLYESAMNNIGYECKADEVLKDIAEHRIGIWLGELPSVQPRIDEEIQNRQDMKQVQLDDEKLWWMPCSERLPEKSIGEWLCCTDEGEIMILRYDTPGYGSKECVFYKWDDNGYFYQIFNVVAWMPLPEPYRKEGEKR